MTTHDTWILVSIPSRPGGRTIATRIGLALLGWADEHRERRDHSIALDRVARQLPVQRPFC